MATRLWLEDTAGGSSPLPLDTSRALVLVQGTGGTTYTTPTVNSGTDIQVRITNALEARGVYWITDYVLTPFLFAGTVTTRNEFTESGTTVNAGFRARFYKIPWDGPPDPVLALTLATATEIGTGPGTQLASGAPATPVQFNLNDRLVIVYSIINIGTMAAGTCNIKFGNGGSGNDASYVELAENVTFSATPIPTPFPRLPRLGARGTL